MNGKLCSDCHRDEALAYDVRCRLCHNAQARVTRRNYNALSAEDKKRADARSKLHMRMRRGKISPPSYCELCGLTRKVQAHHADYDKPYQVVWVCAACHRLIHSNASSPPPSLWRREAGTPRAD